MVIPLDFLRIPLIGLIGWMFYNEKLDLAVFAGRGTDRCGDRLEHPGRDPDENLIVAMPHVPVSWRFAVFAAAGWRV